MEDKTKKLYKLEEDFLFSLIDNSSDAIIATDIKGYVLIFNEAAQNMTGYNAADLLNKQVSFRRFMGRGEQERILSILNKGTADRPLKLVGEETTLYAKDGTLIPISLSVSYIYKRGVPVATMNIFRDLRPINLVRDKLRVSEEKYRILVEKANDGIFVYQDHYFRYANHKFIEMLGYSEKELLKMGLRDIVHPELADFIEDRYVRRIRGEKVPDQYEISFVGKDGNWGDFEITPALIEYEGSVATQNIIRDITQRKRMERELAETRKMAILGEMSAHVAHEVRNPLQKIKTGLELFSFSISLDKKQKKILEGVNQGIENLERFVTEVLDWSRSGKLKLKIYHVGNIIDGLIFNHETEFNERNIKVKTDYDTGADSVMADGIQLRQAIEDILDNAMDAMQSGGILAFKTHLLESHSFETEGGRVISDALEISISDTGPGIPEDELKKVFQPFFTTKKRGTGLGLSLVQKVVEAHGGYVFARNVPKKGAEFVIRLPLDPTKTMRNSKYTEPSI